MAGELIGALRVTLGLDTAQFESGAKKARARAESDSKAIQKSLDGIKGRIDAVYAGIAGSALIAAGKRALDYASSLGEVAQQLGVTTKELQEYRYAGSQVGVSTEQMDTALSKLTKTIGEAKAGSKAQATTFRELGVAIQDANGRVYTAGEVIPKLADALSNVKDPATRARLEVELFGKTGQKLDTLLSGGSAAVNELRDAAQKLGVVLSDRQIQNADDTADKLAAVKQVLEARIAGTVADNANAILTLANAFATLTGKAIQFVSEYPRIAAALAGAAAGSRLGAVGAVVGGAGGALIGDGMAKSADDQNMDVKFRLQQLRSARAQRSRLKSSQSSGGLLTFKKVDSRTQGATLGTATAEVVRQMQLLSAAMSATKGSKATASLSAVGDGDLPTVAASGSPKKAPKPTGPTAAEIEAKFEEEMSQLHQEQLQAQLALTNDAEDRADLQSQMLVEEYNERKLKVDNDKHFTQAQKDAQTAALKALYGISGDGENIVVGGNKNSLSAGISRDLQEKLAQQEYDVLTSRLDADRDALQGQLNMARTADERRRLQLEILDIEYKLRAAKLDQVINSETESQAAKDLATLAKQRLESQRGLDEATVKQQTMGPLAAYLNGIPKTVGEINESLQQTAVDGLRTFNDGITEAIMGTKSLGSVFKSVAKQILADIIRLQVQKATSGLISGLLGAATSVFGGGQGGGGIVLGGAAKGLLDGDFGFPGIIKGYGSGSWNLDGSPGFGTTTRLPGMASGGTIGGFPGTDKNVLSINGIPRVRVSASERIRVEPSAANENGRSGPTIVMNNDFRGADAGAVAGISAKLDQLDRQLETRAVSAYVDARDRRLVR